MEQSPRDPLSLSHWPAIIAPEADFAGLAGTAQMRDGLDLDSMDFLNFIAGLHERAKIDIPEADYPKLATLDGGATYLGGKMSLSPQASTRRYIGRPR